MHVIIARCTGPTTFFNDGNRGNLGEVQEGYESGLHGYIIGAVGPRFEGAYSSEI